MRLTSTGYVLGRKPTPPRAKSSYDRSVNLRNVHKYQSRRLFEPTLETASAMNCVNKFIERP